MPFYSTDNTLLQPAIAWTFACRHSATRLALCLLLGYPCPCPHAQVYPFQQPPHVSVSAIKFCPRPDTTDYNNRFLVEVRSLRQHLPQQLRACRRYPIPTRPYDILRHTPTVFFEFARCFISTTLHAIDFAISRLVPTAPFRPQSDACGTPRRALSRSLFGFPIGTDHAGIHVF